MASLHCGENQVGGYTKSHTSANITWCNYQWEKKQRWSVRCKHILVSKAWLWRTRFNQRQVSNIMTTKVTGDNPPRIQLCWNYMNILLDPKLTQTGTKQGRATNSSPQQTAIPNTCNCKYRWVKNSMNKNYGHHSESTLVMLSLHAEHSGVLNMHNETAETKHFCKQIP